MNFIHSHLGKLLRSSNKEQADRFTELVEDVIIAKLWTEYTDWVDLHEEIIKRSRRVKDQALKTKPA